MIKTNELRLLQNIAASPKKNKNETYVRETLPLRGGRKTSIISHKCPGKVEAIGLTADPRQDLTRRPSTKDNWPSRSVNAEDKALDKYVSKPHTEQASGIYALALS